MNYRSYKDLMVAVDRLNDIVPRDIGLVVGIPRSGIIPATAFALLRNLAVCDLPTFLEGRAPWRGTRARTGGAKVLVLDDSASSGGAMLAAKKELATFSNASFCYAACYASDVTRGCLNYFAEVVPEPRVFQWNLFHSDILQRCILDIDGVLCRDPTEEENDDGPKYLKFIETVKPKYLPTWPIGAIATSRLEKYREPTEAWLAKHGIEHAGLVMLRLDNKQQRQEQNAAARWKATGHEGTTYLLFVESDPAQARLIKAMTGHPVLCASEWELV